MATDLLLSNNPIYGVPELAFSNLVEGNVSGAVRSFYDPDSLTPDERESIAARFGIKDSFLGKMVNIATNPLWLAGLLFSVKWPMPNAKALALWSGDIEKLKPMTGLGKWLSPMMTRLEGTSMFGTLQEMSRRYARTGADFHATWGKEMQSRLGAIDTTEAQRLAAMVKLGDLSNPQLPMWQQAIERLRSSGKHIEASELIANIPKLRTFADSQGPAADALADSFRLTAAKLWDDYKLDDPVVQKQLLHPWFERMGMKAPETIKREDLLLMRTRLMTPEMRESYTLDQISKYMPEELRSGLKTTAKLRWNTPHVLERTGSMLPDPSALKAAGFSDGAVSAVANGSIKDTLDNPVFFDMNYDRMGLSYFRSMARAITLHLKGAGDTQPLIERFKSGLKEVAKGDYDTAATVAHTVFPQILGGKSDAQALSALNWMSTKSYFADKLTSGPLAKAIEALPGGIKSRDSLLKWMRDDPSSSLDSMGYQTASLIYSATLGLPNVSPAFLNHLQLLNVVPYGAKAFSKAYGQSVSEVMEYAKLRVSQGLTPEEALSKASPTFTAHALELEPAVMVQMSDQFESVLTRVRGGQSTIGKWSEGIQKSLLSLFKQSEVMNRLVAFHTGYNKFIDDMPESWVIQRTGQQVNLKGLAKDAPEVLEAAGDFGAQTVFRTQFGGGPLQTPSGMLNWNPLFKQYMSFPIRQAGLIAGQMTQHPGYLSRVAALTGLAYGAGREFLGADLSRGLTFGSVPGPAEYGPFAPLPVMPPILGISGSALLSIASGDSREFRRALPAMIPGGVGTARALSAVSPSAGKFFDRPSADYGKRRPDGKVPVYTPKGQLLGWYTDTQIMARAMGLGDVSGQREQQLARWLTRQTEGITDRRRQMLQAIQENDAIGQMKIREEFDRVFPGVPFPVRESDYKAMERRQNLTRIDRLITQLPPDLRDQYRQAASVALGAAAPDFMGQAPSSARPQLRQDYRRPPTTNRPPSKGLHGVSMQDKLREAGIDNARKVKRDLTFTGFPSYTPASTDAGDMSAP